MGVAAAPKYIYLWNARQLYRNRMHSGFFGDRSNAYGRDHHDDHAVSIKNCRTLRP
jgi:hypothetical protein